MESVKSKKYFIQKLSSIEQISNLIVVSCLVIIAGSIALVMQVYNSVTSQYYYWFPKDASLLSSSSSYFNDIDYTWVGMLSLCLIGGIIAYIVLAIVFQNMLYSFMKDFYPTFNSGIKDFWILCIPIVGPFLAYFKYKELTMEIIKYTGDIQDYMPDEGISFEPGSIFNISGLRTSLLFFVSSMILNPTLMMVTIPALLFNSKIEQQYIETVAGFSAVAYAIIFINIFIIPTMYVYNFNKRLQKYLLIEVSKDNTIPDLPPQPIVIEQQTPAKNEYIENVKNAVLNIKTENSDFIGKLEKIEELYNRGAITEEEYSVAKKKILEDS